MSVRLIRDVTPSGSVRILMTSLLDEARYPATDFGALYHHRWRIEEAGDLMVSAGGFATSQRTGFE